MVPSPRLRLNPVLRVAFAIALLGTAAGVSARAAEPAAAPPAARAAPVKKTCDGHKVPDGHPFEAIHEVQPACAKEVDKEFELAGTLAKVRAAISEKSKALAAAAANAGASSAKDALEAVKNTIKTSVADLNPSFAAIAQAQKDLGITHDLANASAGKINAARATVNAERLKLLEERLKLTNDYNLMVQKQLPERQQLLARQKSQGIPPAPGLENSIVAVQSRITSDKARLDVLAVDIPKFEQAEKSFVAAYADHQNIARGLVQTRADLAAQNTELTQLVAKSNGLIASLDGASKGLGQVPSPDSTSTNANVATATGAAPLTPEQKKMLQEYSHGAALEAGIADGIANPGATTVNGADTSAMSQEERLKLTAQEATLKRQQQLDADLSATGGYDGLAARTRSGVAQLATYQGAILNTDDDAGRDAAVKKYNAFMASECQNTAVCAEYTRLGVMREVTPKNFTEIVNPVIDPGSGFSTGISEDTGKSAFTGNLGLKSALKETTSASYRSDVEEGQLKEQETLNSGYKRVADAAAAATKEREWAQSKAAQDTYTYSQQHAYDFSDGGMPMIMEDPKVLAAQAGHKLVDANAYAAGLMSTTDATSHNFVMDGVAGANKDHAAKEMLVNTVGVVPILGTTVGLVHAQNEATDARFDTAQTGSAASAVAAEEVAKEKVSSAKVALAVDVATTVLPLDKLVIHPAASVMDWMGGGAVRATETAGGATVRAGGSEVARVAESTPMREFAPITSEPAFVTGKFAPEMHASVNQPVIAQVDDAAARLANDEVIAARRIATATEPDATVVARAVEADVADNAASRAPASVVLKPSEEPVSLAPFSSPDNNFRFVNDFHAADFEEAPAARAASRTDVYDQAPFISVRREAAVTEEAVPFSFAPQQNYAQYASHPAPVADLAAYRKFDSVPVKGGMVFEPRPAPVVTTHARVDFDTTAPAFDRRQAVTSTTASMAPASSAASSPLFTAASRDLDRGVSVGYGLPAPAAPAPQRALSLWDRVTGSVKDAIQIQSHPIKSITTAIAETSTNRELSAAVKEVAALPRGEKLAEEARNLTTGMREDFMRQRDALRSASVETRSEARASADYSIRQRVASFDKAQNEFKAANAANPEALASAERLKKATNAKLAVVEDSNAILSGKELSASKRIEGTTASSRFSAETMQAGGVKFSAQAVEMEKTLGVSETELRRQTEELVRLRASREMRGNRLAADQQIRYEALELRNASRETPLITNDIDGRKFWDGAQSYAKMSAEERQAWLKEIGDTRHPEADKIFTRFLAGETDDATRRILRNIANHRGFRVDYQSIMGSLSQDLVTKGMEGGMLPNYVRRELKEMPSGKLATFLSSPVMGVRFAATEGLLGRDPIFLAKYIAGDDLPVARVAVMALRGNSSEEAKALLIKASTNGDRDIRRESINMLLKFHDYDAKLAVYQAAKNDLPELAKFQENLYTIKQKSGGIVEFTPKVKYKYSDLGDNAFVTKMLASDRKTVLDAAGDVSSRPAAVSYQLLRHDDPEVRQKVANSLFQGSVSDKQAIADLLKDPVAEVRVEAVRAIARPEYVSIDRTYMLRRVAQGDADAQVRAEASLALGMNSSANGEKFFESRAMSTTKYINEVRAEIGNVPVNEDHLLAMAVARHIYSYPEMKEGMTAEKLVAQARDFELSSPAGVRPSYVITDFASGAKGGVYKPEILGGSFSEKPVIVAWGGTEGTTDLLADMNFGIEQAKSAAAKHVNEVALKEVIENKSHMIAVGHSLGGALAEGTGAQVGHALTERAAKMDAAMLRRETGFTSDLVKAQNREAVAAAMDRTQVITFQGLGGVESIKAAGQYFPEEAALLKTTNYRLSSDVISRLGTHVGTTKQVDLGSQFGFFAAAKDHLLDSLHDRFLKSTSADMVAAKATKQISMDALQKPVGATATAILKMRASAAREDWVKTLMDARRLQAKEVEFGRIKPEFSYFKQDLYDAVEQMSPAKREIYRKKLADLETEIEQIKAPLQRAAPSYVAAAESTRAPASVAAKGMESEPAQVKLWSLAEAGKSSEAEFLRADLENTLLVGNAISENEIGRGLSQPTLLTFEDGTKAVWKPFEAHLGGNPEAFRTANGASEIAAFRVDRQLKLNEVPLTVSRSHNGASGTAQLFVETSAKDVKPTELRPAHFATFDYLIDEPDRSSVNYLRSGDRWIAIDHGGSFTGSGLDDYPAKVRGLLQKGDSAAQDTLKQMFPPRESLTLLRDTKPAEWKRLLSAELTKPQIDAFLGRRNTVLGLVKQVDDQLGASFLKSRGDITSATIADAAADGQISANMIAAAEGVATAGAIRAAGSPAVQGYAARVTEFFNTIFKNTIVTMMKSLGVNLSDDEKARHDRKVASPAHP